MTGTDLDQAIERVVESFQIGHVLGRRIGNLSKGYQQRVSLAQAFLHDPPIVIVDEPTAGLDPVQRAEVQGMLGALQGQRTVLLCTHDLHEARSLTTRVAVLHAGHLVAQGLTERIIRDDSALALFRDPHRESS